MMVVRVSRITRSAERLDFREGTYLCFVFCYASFLEPTPRFLCQGIQK